MTDEEHDANAERREAIAKRFCTAMGWDYHTSPVWTGIRKVAMAEALVLGLDKAEEILKRLETATEDYQVPKMKTSCYTLFYPVHPDEKWIVFWYNRNGMEVHKTFETHEEALAFMRHE